MERYPTTAEAVIWSVTSVPYVVHVDLNIEHEMGIEAGVAAIFDDGSGLDVRSGGRLTVGDVGGAPVPMVGPTEAQPGSRPPWTTPYDAP